MLACDAWAQVDAPFCQILDRYDMPPWFAQAGYTAAAGVDEGDEIAVLRLQGGGGLAYARTGIGDFDLTGRYRLDFLTDDGGLGLPDHYGAVWLGGSYILRRSDGYAGKLDIAPGLYTDFDDLSGDDVAFPFTVSLIRSVHEQLSVLAGLAVFPGFERSWDPRLGARWSPVSQLTFDLMYPESRVTLYPQEGWEVYAGVGLDRTSQFALDEDDEREALLLEETRWSLGLSHPLGDGLRMTWEAGLVMNRRLEFARHGSDRDVEDAYNFTVGIGAAL